MSEAEYLRLKAQRCFRLARSINDPKTVAELEELANAVRIEAGACCSCGVLRYSARMAASDLDIQNSALLWTQTHGDDATPKAREMVEAMRKKGDADGADVWLRISVAIGTLSEGPRPVAR